MTNQDGVCVFSERHEVALELLAAGRKLTDGELIAVAADANDDARVTELFARGATQVFLIESDDGAQAADLHVEALAQVLDRLAPAAVLIS